MTLTYTRGLGRLTATDNTQPGEPFVFDTNDGLLFVDPDDFFEGSIAVPNRTASSQGVDGAQNVVDIEQDYYVGTPTTPGSRYVRGLIRTTASSGGEAMDGIWRQASGTHIDVMDGVSFTSVPQSDLSGFQRLATLGGYTFFVNELGHLVMRERIVARARDPGNPGTTFNRVRQNVTVDYRLLVGSFFGADFSPFPPAAQFRGRGARSDSPGATHTISNVPFGYGYPGRQLLAVLHSNSSASTGRTLSSVTIGGVPATILGGIGGVANVEVSTYFAIVELPAGVQGDVTMAWSGGHDQTAVGIYAVVGATGTPVINVTGINGGSSASHSVAIGANKLGIGAVTFIGLNPADAVVSNIDLSILSRVSGATVFGFPGQAHGIIPPGLGTANISASWPSGSGDIALASIVWP